MIDVHEDSDLRLSRGPGGELRSNFKYSAQKNANNAQNRTRHIAALERQRDVLMSTGDKDGAKRFAIQAAFERASQVADSRRRRADMATNQASRDEHERRAREAKDQLVDAQMQLAKLDLHTGSEHSESAEVRLTHFGREVEMRKAEESKLAEQVIAERNAELFRSQVEARELDFKNRIEPAQQGNYTALVDDMRQRWADTHGQGRDTYVMSDTERQLSHQAIVEGGYGQTMRLEADRIREVEGAPAQQEQTKLDLQRFATITARQAELLNNDQYIRQPANEEQAQRPELLTASQKMLEAGYVAERKADHIAYAKQGGEQVIARDFGNRISADSKTIQDADAKRDVIALVADKFPKGFEIRCADDERKLEYAREAVRQGHADKVRNPELVDFIAEYKQQHAEDQRSTQSQAFADVQRDVESQPQAEKPPTAVDVQVPVKEAVRQVDATEPLRVPTLGGSPLDAPKIERADAAPPEVPAPILEQTKVHESAEQQHSLHAPTLGASLLDSRQVDQNDAEEAHQQLLAQQAHERAFKQPALAPAEQSEQGTQQEPPKEAQPFTWHGNFSDSSDAELHRLAASRQVECAPAGAESESDSDSEQTPESESEAAAEPVLSHLPDDVAESLRASMAAEAALQAKKDAERDADDEQQQRSQVL